MNSNTHYSVLLEESISLLDIKPDGVYVDGTFGRGGHARAILDKLGNNGRLIAFDKDVEAISAAKQNIHDERFIMVHGSFANLNNYLKTNNIIAIDGLLLDLGVSSPQLDTPDRGFSFRFNAPLDMRMDTTHGKSVKEWINQASESEIDEILWKYGEEKFHKKIASNIVKSRALKPIETTTDLVKIIEQCIIYKEKGQHPATRSFQAMRIFINNELSDVETILNDIPEFLRVNGRVVVISFHSLEDRIVKNYFNFLTKPIPTPKWIMVDDKGANYQIIAKKIKASLQELNENVRSRSAIMRSLERLK